MLWLNVSQNACTSISMQSRNPITRCTCIYSTTRFILSSLHDNQNFFLILPRLKCRDEQLLHLNNKYQNLDEEVMSLRMQLRREEEKCKRLVDSNKQVAEDRDQFKDR